MAERLPIRESEIRAGVRALGLSGRPLEVHSSLSSFGDVSGGAEAVLDALLAEDCTVLVPSFSYWYEVPRPVDRLIARNGESSATTPPDNIPNIFDPRKPAISPDMGAIPAALLRRPDRVRGNHPLNSFAALGPIAPGLIAGQSPGNVYAPLRALADAGGWALLMGVSLTRLTLIHAAEQGAGRTLFRRWARGPDGAVIATEVGSCSEGFERLRPVLEPIARHTTVGASRWLALPIAETIRLVVEAIHQDPAITHCVDAECVRCRDAIAGGPVLAQ